MDTVGSKKGAEQDTNYFRLAAIELGQGATLREILARAQKLKEERSK